MIEVTGRLPHTTRAALTGLRKRGFPLERMAGEGGSVYRVATADPEPAREPKRRAGRRPAKAEAGAAA